MHERSLRRRPWRSTLFDRANALQILWRGLDGWYILSSLRAPGAREDPEAFRLGASGEFATFQGEADVSDPLRRDKFGSACSRFLAEVDGLRARGAEAFLTTALEESLLSFTTFLRASSPLLRPGVRSSSRTSCAYLWDRG
jgi:hypothetical protein